MKKKLSDHLPEGTTEQILRWQSAYGFELKITRDRNSKFGDYRSPFRGKPHRITVNTGLNKYAFLITLLHEIAHLLTWNDHKNKVKSHGDEWKRHFKKLIEMYLNELVFPHDVEMALVKSLNKLTASSCSDTDLYKVLHKYDDKKGTIFLEELQQYAIFKTPTGKTFKKGERVRKRYLCNEIGTRKKYLFSPVAEVYMVTLF